MTGETNQKPSHGIKSRDVTKPLGSNKCMSCSFEVVYLVSLSRGSLIPVNFPSSVGNTNKNDTIDEKTLLC